MSAPEELKPCPFCGWQPPVNDLMDVLYPRGIYWREHADGCRSYHSHSERREGDQPCWEMNCTFNMGGCGAEVHGDSRDEAVAAWNRRPTENPLDCAMVRASPAPQAGVPREPDGYFFEWDVPLLGGCMAVHRSFSAGDRVNGRECDRSIPYYTAAPSADAGVREALQKIVQHAEFKYVSGDEDELDVRNAQLAHIVEIARAILSPAAQQPTETKR